jgi:hypothetical protein
MIRFRLSLISQTANIANNHEREMRMTDTVTAEEQLVDIESLENTDPSTGRNSQPKYDRPAMLPKGKDQVWPIIGRFLVNRIATEAYHYHEVHDHNIQIGGRWINVPCYKTRGTKCPFCEAYWAARKDVQTLTGKGANTEDASDDLRIELKKKQLVMKMMEQRQRYGMIMALPKDPTVYMFFATKSLISEIFGNKDKNTKGAFSVLRDEYKVPVFKAEEKTGWFSLNKTGQKLETRYFASPAVTQVVKERTKTEMLYEEELHPTVIERAKRNDIPRVKAYYDSRFWSLEEMENFIESDFTQVPERYARFIPQEDQPKVKGSGVIDSREIKLNAITSDDVGGELIENMDPF